MRGKCINTQVMSAGKNLSNYERNWKGPARKKTCPRKYDLYDIFCAVLYVTQDGIQWRMLLSDYPKWQIVYYFRVWSEREETGVSVLERVLQKLVKQIRNEDLRRDKTTFGIIDAQSVQNADTAEEKGYDTESIK